MAAIIQVTDLRKAFNGQIAVDGVSFSVPKGCCFGLLGPNGAGKTTTIEMLEGLSRPDSGQIEYLGPLAGNNLYQHIGIQFQHTALQDYLTTAETIEMFSALYPKPMPLSDLVTLCQLHDFLKQDHRKLSGGQRQRLLLALALVNDPDILFLDEPTTGLDPQARRHFWALVQRIKAAGKTILLTTHYMDEAEVLCDEIVVMDNGKIIEQGQPQALLREHFHAKLVRLPLPAMSADMAEQLGAEPRGDSLEISTNDVTQTMTQLTNAGVALEGIQISSANLDDLFLKLTGHELRA